MFKNSLSVGFAGIGGAMNILWLSARFRLLLLLMVSPCLATHI